MGELFTDQKLHDTFMEINRNLAEMNVEIKNLRKDLTQMNELWRSYEELREEFTIFKQQHAGRNQTWDSIRLWGSLLIATAAFLVNFVRG